MHALIFLNGKLPRSGLIKKFIQKDSFIVAADGGANRLRRLRIKPDVIIGDLDSISKASLSYFLSNNTEVIKISEQETTDFEKALKHCLKIKIGNAVIFGATSMRPDHSLNNFSILKRYYKKIDIKFITDEYEIEMAERKMKFKYKKNGVVSLLAMPFAGGIKTSGLQYQLNNEDLEFGKKEGTLNRAISDEIKITFRKGDLLIFKKHFL
jgi:thiamine pyrophosphokinase